IKPPCAILDVRHRPLKKELAHGLEPGCPRTESRKTERLVRVGTPRKPHLRIEVRADTEALVLHTIPIVLVVELRVITHILVVAAVGLGSRPVGVDDEILEEREDAVHAVGLCGADTVLRDGPPGKERAHTAPPKDVALEANDGK